MPRYLKANIILLPVLFLIFANPAASELYQYIDENGIMRLTDNIYSVPVDSRAKLEQFSEFEGISDKLEILPINNKSVTQTKTEKTIQPKTPKKISAEVEENVTLPAPALDASKKRASEPKKDPAPTETPVLSEKEATMSEPEAPVRDISKSRRITIHRPATDSGKMATTPIATEEYPKTEPGKKKTAVRETQTVKKEQTKQTADAKTEPALAAKQIVQSKKTDIDKHTGTSLKTAQIEEKKPLIKEKNEIKAPVTQIKKIKTAKTTPIVKKPADKIPDRDAAELSDKVQKKNPAPAKEIAAIKKRAPALLNPEPVTEKAAAKKVQPDTVKKPVTDQTVTETAQPLKTPHKQRVPVPDDGKPKTPKIPESKTDKTDQTSAAPLKTENSAPRMGSEKTTSPEIVHKKDAETATETSGRPEEKDNIKSFIKTDSPAISNKDIKEKEITANQQTADPQRASQESAEKNEKTIIQPDSNQKSIQKPKHEPQILNTASDGKIIATSMEQLSQRTEKEPKVTAAVKVVTDQKKAAVKKTALTQPEITPRTTIPDNPGKSIPEIDQSDLTTENQSLPEKKSPPLMAVNTSDKGKASEATTPKSPGHQAVSKEPSPEHRRGKTELAVEKMNSTGGIEAVSSTPDEKTENLILAHLETTRLSLAEKKEALNKKFLRLMKEKQEIENSVDEDDEESVLKYNENVKRLNLKIKQYKTEKKNLQAEIEKYNNKIRQLN